MTDLRALLIDCRIELRRLVRDFHATPLCERLDAATQQLANAPVETPEPPAASGAGLRQGRETSNQVALAWQLAARDLKFSHPPLYEAMSRKVMARLETSTLVDQVDELRRLEASVDSLREQQAEVDRQRQAVESERDTVLGALASAVPQLADGGDRIGVALARIDCLKAQATKSAPVVTVGTVSEEESRFPSPEVIALIAAGARQFTQAQREWCVGEAMVLSGFKYTPIELIEQGDASIARIIAGARRPSAARVRATARAAPTVPAGRAPGPRCARPASARVCRAARGSRSRPSG
jgi:hypothetical protein